MSSSWLLGIDFGTANTAAASMEPGSSPSVVPLAGERTVMPSAVFVESPNTITAGRAVIDAADRNPGGVTPTPKRSVGLHAVPINGYDIAPVRLVTAVLGETVNRAIAARTAQLGRAESPAQLILTHPEDWTPDEIRVLHDAAAALGFDPASVRVISEPRATAHQCVSANIAAGTKFGVVDVGAGTLDVTVLEATGRGEFTVVAEHRDHALGGAAVDAAVRGWVDSRLAAENPQLLTYLRENSPAGDLRDLDDSIRRAKELLSTALGDHHGHRCRTRPEHRAQPGDFRFADRRDGHPESGAGRAGPGRCGCARIRSVHGVSDRWRLPHPPPPPASFLDRLGHSGR